jgi:glycosyltransferase involved in cell wall biosynthesis
MTHGRHPVVSVIVPAFNNGSFIKFAIESIFRQTYPAGLTEIIVIDDGSDDNTGEIVHEYLDRVTYIYQENRGIAGARNRGLAVAKGWIITFLDADDEWYEERIRKVVNKFMESPEAGLVYHSIELIDSNGNIIHRNFNKSFGYKEGIRGWVTNDISSGRIFCGGSSFAFRRDVVKRAYPVPEDIKRGIDFYMVALSSCYAQAEYIPETLGKYRLHGDNTTMFAGHRDCSEMAKVNMDFAHMRQRFLEIIKNCEGFCMKAIDLNTIKRVRAKEIIFYNVLTGKRIEGIRQIPALFKGDFNYKDFLKGIAVSFVALFVPGPFFHNLVKGYGFLQRLKYERFTGY